MSRPLRIEFPGALYHIMARGDGRAAIYRDAADRMTFLAGVGKTCKRFDWRVWAYCLMGNHYHLLVETRQATLSRGMREINGIYTQAFNRRYRRSGHVLQGRYKAILVDKDAWLLELSRYIVLNPVRAKLCASAGDWPWSSYNAVMGKTSPTEWLAVNELLEAFNSDRGAARRAYARFVADGVAGNDPHESTSGQVFLGDEAFVARAIEQAGIGDVSAEVPRKQRRWKSLASHERECANRDAAIRAAYESGGYSLRSIGEHFGLHYSTVSRIARSDV